MKASMVMGFKLGTLIVHGEPIWSYLVARCGRDAHRGTPIIARHAHSPSTPYASGVTLRASGVDRSRGPSKKAQHAINAQAMLRVLTHNLAVMGRYAPCTDRAKTEKITH